MKRKPGISADARDFVDGFDGARLVGLHGEAEAAPLRMGTGDVARERLEHVERQLETIALFGVDGEVEVGGGGQVDKLPHARHELGEDALALRFLVAREQCRELDRDAVGLFRTADAAAAPDGGDRIGIRREIALGVALGARALAEHVVAEAQARLDLARARRFAERFADGATEHELAAEQLDRAHRRRDDRLRTETAEQARCRPRHREGIASRARWHSPTDSR